ncbi:MAG TPA: D-glycero-beta-D-manno-heptose 1-phosphate adenylyltransferase [Verrucomicrobiae bacterium]
MSFSGEIVSLADLPAWRQKLRDKGLKLVVTHGCFDILHAGHVSYLQQAREQGDVLLVGLNADASIKGLKGPNRPINNEGDRAQIMAALRSVDAVTLFPEVRATNLLKAAQPDVYVKGGDYTLETLNPEERAVVQAAGAKIVFIQFLEGRSTTSIIERSKQ